MQTDSARAKRERVLTGAAISGMVIPAAVAAQIGFVRKLKFLNESIKMGSWIVPAERKRLDASYP